MPTLLIPTGHNSDAESYNLKNPISEKEKKLRKHSGNDDDYQEAVPPGFPTRRSFVFLPKEKKVFNR